jgi:hypothetical protein
MGKMGMQLKEEKIKSRGKISSKWFLLEKG